jgi:hypothetical protein
MGRWMAGLVALFFAAACDAPPEGDAGRFRRLVFGSGQGESTGALGSGRGSGGVEFGTGGGAGGISFGQGGGSGGTSLGGSSGGTSSGGSSGGAVLRPATCEAACAFFIDCGGTTPLETCIDVCRAGVSREVLACVARADSCAAGEACLQSDTH